VNGFSRVVALLVAFRVALRRLRGRGGVSLPEAPARPEIDPSEREVPGNARAEALVAGLLVVAGLLGLAFIAVFAFAGTNAQLLGGAMGAMLAVLGAAAIIAGKAVVPQEIDVEDRGALLREAEAAEVVGMIEGGGEGVSRRGLLVGASGFAGAAFVAAAAAPVASLGPRLHAIHGTTWRRGVGLVDDEGRPYLADDIEEGVMYTALPEGGDPEHLDAGLIVVRLSPSEIKLPPARAGWAPRGILAYTKICPHAGCAISMYRYPTYQATSAKPAVTCPCHYSTFLPGEGGRLVFGPAGRALSQLPLMIDAHGQLRAAGRFHEDVGPSWWNVHRGQT
jgi:ubiquinol-cytochrome c reductase iron-sulfur subunit